MFLKMVLDKSAYFEEKNIEKKNQVPRIDYETLSKITLWVTVKMCISECFSLTQ